MHRILLAGGGKIGSLIASLLTRCGDYEIFLIDKEGALNGFTSPSQPLTNFHLKTLDASDVVEIIKYIKKQKINTVISALPFHCNRLLAKIAHELQLYYFDLSEDVENAKYIQQLASNTMPAFVPQCGLAPGFISIVANHLISHFESIDTVKMRVGALPLHPNNALKYSLTWSTDGLINEYINPCYGLEDGKIIRLKPLEGYETIMLDGDRYEAFNTSGGLGTLADSFSGIVNNMNYKTLRYPGHCAKMQFLLQDLRLNRDRKMLKHILENAIPQTFQDVVLIYVSVTGKYHGNLFEKSDVRKIYPAKIAGRHWSAIQLSTATGLCSVVDITLNQKLKGFIRQENFTLPDILQNRFGAHLENTQPT